MGKSDFDDGMMRCVGLGISNTCEGGMMGGMVDATRSDWRVALKGAMLCQNEGLLAMAADAMHTS